MESTDHPAPPAGRPRWASVSVAALIGANLVPLLGVLLAGWRVFTVLLLFSLENIVIGVFNVLRMAKARCDLDELKRSSQGTVKTKAGMLSFFCMNYGLFVLVHLGLVVAIFGVVYQPGVSPDAELVPGPGGGSMHPGFRELVNENWWAVSAALGSLAVGHGMSYWRNFIGEGEYKRVTANELMTRPYGRVVVLHLTILGAGWLVATTGNHASALALLVVLKIILDLNAHLRERKKFAPA